MWWFGKNKKDCNCMHTKVRDLVNRKPKLGDYSLSEFIFKELGNVKYVETTTREKHESFSYPKKIERIIDFTIKDNDNKVHEFMVAVTTIGSDIDEICSSNGHYKSCL